MSTFILGVAALLVLGLIALDLVVMRHADRFDGVKPDSAERVWAKDRPPVVTAAAFTFLALGALSFPATLAPTVMTVLTFQRHRLLSEAWVSLAAMIVATLSMSAAIKCLRVSHLLRYLTDEMRPLLKWTVLFLVLWELLVLVLTVTMRPIGGSIGVLIWSYVAVTTIGTGVVVAAARVALGLGDNRQSASV